MNAKKNLITIALLAFAFFIQTACKKVEEEVVCIPPTGIMVKNITISSVEFSWNAAEDAQQYLLEYRKSGTTAFTVVRVTAGVTSKIENLLAGTTYEYRLQTNCSGSNSNYGELGNFTTLTSTEYYLPNKWRIKFLKENNVQSLLGNDDFIEFVKGGALNQTLTIAGTPTSYTGSWSLQAGDTVTVNLSNSKKWKVNNIDATNLLLIKNTSTPLTGIDTMRMEIF